MYNRYKQAFCASATWMD